MRTSFFTSWHGETVLSASPEGTDYRCSMKGCNIVDFVGAIVWCENHLPKSSWLLHGSEFWFREEEHLFLFRLIWASGDRC